MFDSIWSALIAFGFALLVGTIADLLYKRSDFKWYWNLLFGVIGLFIIGPLIVSILSAIGITLPLSIFGLPVAWVDLFWELVFGIIGTFLLLTLLNALFWKKDADGNDRSLSSRPSRDVATGNLDGSTSRDRSLDTDSRNRIVTDNPRREDTVSGDEFLEIRDNRDPDDRI